MKIAMIGAGAIGALLGSFIKKSGMDIILIDPYKAHMDKIRESGLKVTAGDTMATEYVPMECYTSAEGLSPVDMVIVLVKGPFTKGALEKAGNLFDGHTVVATFQNGIGNELILQDMFSDDRIIYGNLHFTSRLVAPGEVEGMFNMPGTKIMLGTIAKEGPAAEAARAFCGPLTDIGFSAEYTPDVDRAIWEKAASNVPCNALCGILRMTVGAMYSHESGVRIMTQTLRELCDVGRAKGIDLDYDKFLDDFNNIYIKVVAGHYPSMTQDVMNKKPTEIETLNGAVSRYGRQLGVPTPANDLIADMIRIIQDNYDKQF